MTVLQKETAGSMLALLHINPVFYKGGNTGPDIGLNKIKKAIHMKNNGKYLTYSLKIEV